jgi:hypothetical protein
MPGMGDTPYGVNSAFLLPCFKCALHEKRKRASVNAADGS